MDDYPDYNAILDHLKRRQKANWEEQQRLHELIKEAEQDRTRGKDLAAELANLIDALEPFAGDR